MEGIRCASRSSLPMVSVMFLPMAAARRANSPRRAEDGGGGVACSSRWCADDGPPARASRFDALVVSVWNSGVRSCSDTAIAGVEVLVL